MSRTSTSNTPVTTTAYPHRSRSKECDEVLEEIKKRDAKGVILIPILRPKTLGHLQEKVKTKNSQARPNYKSKILPTTSGKLQEELNKLCDRDCSDISLYLLVSRDVVLEVFDISGSFHKVKIFLCGHSKAKRDAALIINGRSKFCDTPLGQWHPQDHRFVTGPGVQVTVYQETLPSTSSPSSALTRDSTTRTRTRTPAGEPILYERPPAGMAHVQNWNDEFNIFVDGEEQQANTSGTASSFTVARINLETPELPFFRIPGIKLQAGYYYQSKTTGQGM